MFDLNRDLFQILWSSYESVFDYFLTGDAGTFAAVSGVPTWIKVCSSRCLSQTLGVMSSSCQTSCLALCFPSVRNNALMSGWTQKWFSRTRRVHPRAAVEHPGLAERLNLPGCRLPGCSVTSTVLHWQPVPEEATGNSLQRNGGQN